MDTQEIKEKKEKAEMAKEYVKWQVLDLVHNQMLSPKEASQLTGIPRSTIYGWIHKYETGGATLLIGKKRGGRRRSYMSFEQEQKLLDSVAQDGKKGLIITAKIIRKKIESELGRPVSKDIAYDLLHRHGWRKITPRPLHPNSNKETQEEFKKNFTNLWKLPRKTLMRQTQDH